MSTHPAPALGALAPRLTELSLRDALGSGAGSKVRARSASRRPVPPSSPRSRPRSPQAEERIAARRTRVPAVTLPQQLPVSQKKDDIADAIRDHQVVIVARRDRLRQDHPDPEDLLELGRGVRGMIGHTQPRRSPPVPSPSASPRSSRRRSAETVGWKVALHRPGQPGRDLRQAHDGRHPARRDPDRPRAARLRHDHHRRGPPAVPQHRLPAGLPRPAAARRPDLKVVITPATIDPERFSRHFGDAPIIEVSGRTSRPGPHRPLLEEDATTPTATRSPRSPTP
ncbi:ATP-dependent helicase HrpA OS=Streptomyces violarus OX=67380 GN=FHS41_004100 PE=4 SV=1 [Streptomyces violarus]